VRTPSPEDDVRGLLLWAASGEQPVAGITVVRPELTDAFVRLVEEATGERPAAIAIPESGSVTPARMAHP
jgi:hypothetical protein